MIFIGGIDSGISADVELVTKAVRVAMFGKETSLTFLRGEDVRTTEGLLVGGNNDGNFRRVRTDRLGSLAVAAQTPLFLEPFIGTTISSNRLLTTATTMAAAQTAAGGVTLNSGNITTINTGYLLSTRKAFPRYMRAPLQFKTRARIEHYTNAVVEFGFGSGNTATASPTVGAYFQVTAGGAVQGVLTFNGVDSTINLSANGVPFTIDNTNKYYTFDIILDDDGATFCVQDTSSGLIVADNTINMAITQPRLSNVTHLPVFWALRITGTAPATAPRLIVTDGYVGALDLIVNSPWQHRLSSTGLSSAFNPTTFAQSGNGANSAAPANATLSNTAAGYTTLGGRFGFVAVAGAATDYNLFNFAVPAPYQFVCTGMDIETYNTGAAVATTPHLLDWSIGFNGASANLNTGAFIREFVGAQSFAVAAAIGAKAERIAVKFDSPIVCEPGLNLSAILRMPVATATASQVIQGGVKFHGYFE